VVLPLPDLGFHAVIFMKRMVVTLFLSLLLVGMVFAQNDFLPAAQVRLTKTEPITVKQFRTQIADVEKAEGRPLTAAEKRVVLDDMINEKLVLQDAERLKITVSDAEINSFLNRLRAQMAQQLGRQPTDAEFSTAIKNETGFELAAYRETIRKQAIFSKYLDAKKPDLEKSIKTPTEQEILEWYNLHKASYVRPDTVRASMILVPFTDAASKTRAKTMADRFVQDIGSNPGKFDEIAVLGQAPNSGYQSGDFGYLPRTPAAQQMVGPELVNIAFGLKQGEVSKTFETVGGYGIIKITEAYTQKNLTLDDIYQLGSTVTLRKYIENGLFQQRREAAFQQATQDIIKELRRGNPFTINEENIKSILNG
jgi:parvulin-like peptidyl-prolyl isomerase